MVGRLLTVCEFTLRSTTLSSEIPYKEKLLWDEYGKEAKEVKPFHESITPLPFTVAGPRNPQKV